MGEGWSDWYAMDFLVRRVPGARHRPPGEVDMGVYADRDAARDPHAGARLPGRRRRRALPGRARRRLGRLHYGDFGKMLAGAPEVHADGEIWAETLWDLRQPRSVGSRPASVAEAHHGRHARSRRPSRPSSTCATRSCRPTRRASAARDDATIWRCSPAAAWASSPAAVDGERRHPAADFAPPPAAGTTDRHGPGRVIGRGHEASRWRAPWSASAGHDSAGYQGARRARTGGFTLTAEIEGTYPVVLHPTGPVTTAPAGSAGHRRR